MVSMTIKVSAQNGRLQFLKRLKAQTPSQMPTQADSTATTVAGLKTDFNALLAKLKASGAMASS